MGQIFGNIFEDEDEKKKQSSTSSGSSQTQTATQSQPQKGGAIFGDIFADSGTAKEVTKKSQETNVTAKKEEEDSFLQKAGGVIKGVALKAVDAGKSVAKWGLDVIRNQVQRNNEAMLEHANWQNKNLGFNGGKEYTSYEEYEQDIPLVKFLNSETGKKVVGGISEATSNVPIKIAAKAKAKYEIAKDAVTGKMTLKDFANLREIGDREYEAALAAFTAERNDPNNPTWQKFLYELQDTGIQSGIGILLSMGTSALARNPQAGLAVSSAYYSALSADEQIQSKGKVDSLGNIAIDVVGDQMINKVLGGVLPKGSGSSIKAALEGFGVEGSTEVIQSLTKYANDYANAPTEEAKNKVLAEAKQYVTSGAIAMEFAVGGTVGGVGGLVTGGASNTSIQPNKSNTQQAAAPKAQPFVAIDNTDIDEVVKELVKLETSGDARTDETAAARVMQLRDAVNDYARAFQDKTQYVASEVSEAPLIDISTVTLPDGKVAVQFQANTEQNGVSSVYDFSQLFSSKEEATKSAQDAIIAWAQTRLQDAETLEERGELAKIMDFAKNPTKMPTNEAVAAERAAEDAAIEQMGEVDATALEADLAKTAQALPELTRTAETVKVGEVIQYVPADAINANKRQTGQVTKINEKSITLRDPSGRTKRVPLTARVTDNISESLSDDGRAVFDDGKAKRKPPTKPKDGGDQTDQDQKQEPKPKKEKKGKKQKTATVQVVADVANMPENVTDANKEDLNVMTMAMGAENPSRSAIESEEYAETIARGLELKNNNAPADGFALGERLVVNNRAINQENTRRTVEEVMSGQREGDRIDNEKMLNRVRYIEGVPSDATADTEVTIYRAAKREIKVGDHITVDKKNADRYVGDRKDSKVYEMKVKLKDLVKSDGIRTEFVYAPKESLNYAPSGAIVATKYPTIHEGGKVKMVEGTPVKIVEGIETFLHEGDGGWIISEASSGRFIAESRSKEGVTAKAKVAIDEVGKKKFIELVKKNQLDIPAAKQYAPSGYASAVFSVDQLGEGGQPETEAASVPIVLSHLDSIKPVEMPELVEIARELMGGQVPQVTKLRGGSTGGIKLGDFTPAAGGRIRLQEFLFKQENLPQAAKTLAHEMGHLIDYLPDANIKRGNLLGRLASLRGFMQSTFSFESGASLPQTERDRLKKEARKAVAKKTKRNQKDFTAADKQAVSELYKKSLAATLKSGGYIENETVKKELMTITQWWKPYDPAVSEAYNKYRESSAELYADAISVLFNAPRRLQDLAPTFYQKFFEGLDSKPDVRDAYFEVQALLSGDREAVVQRRREGVKRMFKDGDYKAIDLHNRRVQERENRRKQYWSHFKHTVIDKNYQIIDRVKKARKQGKSINPDENPEYFLEERNYIGGKIKALFEREFNTIYSTLNENDITWDDFGELLFYERIAAGDRSDVANPRGITPAAAKELIENMKQEYGEARWPIMQAMTEKFRAANKKVSEEAYQAGLYKKDLYDKMQENPAYVTFQVLDHIETGMTSRVYKSLGTLKDVTNPADATMLKIVTTIRAAERNKTTKATIDFLKANFAEEITEAKYARSPKGRFPIPSKLPNQELVTYLEEGVVKGYYVDPYIAETINNQSVGHNAPIVPVIRFMNSTLFRPLFISFNLGFQSFNLIRDFVRFYKNTPTMTFLRAIKRYGQAGRIARVRAFGLPKNASAKDIEAYNLLNKLEEEKVLSVTFNDLIRGESQEEKQIEKILADTGVKEFQPKPLTEKVPKFAKPVVSLLDKAGIFKVTSEMLGFIENLGNLIETLPKAAGVYELGGKEGELTREQKSFIRRKIGSPDFLAGGTFKPITNEVFLFSNAIIQGIRSDLEIATQPQSRSGWWWKTAKISFLPKILMLAVLMGALGDEYKELMESASEYDRTNYTIIPLGRDSTGKPIYFRLPADETSRFLGGIFWKLLRINQNEKTIGSDIMDVMSYTGGQLPSISPAIQSIGATVQFLSGQNPYDSFRGQNVLSDTTFKAGGSDAVKGFIGWQFQQLGGGVFYKFYHEPTAQKEQGNFEKFFNAPVIGNVLGRFVRVSDYGQLEKLKGIEKKVEKEKARETLDERKLLNKYIDEAREKNIRFSTSGIENELIKESLGGRMPSTKEELSEAKNLVKKFRLSLRRGNADPKVTALIDASSNDVKIEILKELRTEMDANEFAALRRDLINSNIVSGEVFNKLMRE